MHARRLSLALITTLLLGAHQALAAVPDRPGVGTVDRAQAEVNALFDYQYQDLATASPLLFRDLVRTGSRARLAATLNDGTALTLGEHARLMIDEFVYEPGGDDNRLAMHVITGAFLFVGGEVESGARSEVEIKTPVGTLGVRGTTVWGGQIDGGYGVLVLDGEVEVRTAGGSVTLHAGEATMISGADAAPAVPAPWSEEKTARAVATISFAQ